MPTVLITGAASGLGFEFAKQYASDGWRVFATCRQPNASALLPLRSERFSIHTLDITDCDQLADLAINLHDQPIDLLINNAAAQGPAGDTASFGHIDSTAWQDVFLTNTIAPVKVTETFLPNVRRSAMRLIVFISSRAGSITERGELAHHRPGGSYIYRTSKAALNAAAKSLSFDLRTENIRILVLHPGWVRTRGGGPNASISADESVYCMRQVISQLKIEETGAFKDLHGTNLSW